jgi:hypothetical protein
MAQDTDQDKADQPLSLDKWPPEGRTLADIVDLIRPATAAVLKSLVVTTDWLSPHAKDIVSYFRLEAFAQPLLQLWNSGALIAKARRGDPISSPVDIPPPSTVWEVRVVDIMRSVIEDPIGHGKYIYDLRFFLEPKAKPKSTAGSATKNWIVAEAKRLKAAGEVNEGTRITDFARLLADRMDKAHETDESISPVGWRYIKNALPNWGLWPVTSIK